MWPLNNSFSRAQPWDGAARSGRLRGAGAGLPLTELVSLDTALCRSPFPRPPLPSSTLTVKPADIALPFLPIASSQKFFVITIHIGFIIHNLRSPRDSFFCSTLLRKLHVSASRLSSPRLVLGAVRCLLLRPPVDSSSSHRPCPKGRGLLALSLNSLLL